MAKHFVTAGCPVEAERVVGTRQRDPQMRSPRRHDLQRTRAGHHGRRGPKVEIQLALTSRQPLRRRGLQRRQLRIVVSGPDMLDIARPAPRGVHDLHSRRSRRRPDRPHIGHRTRLRDRLVHTSEPAEQLQANKHGRQPTKINDHGRRQDRHVPDVRPLTGQVFVGICGGSGARPMPRRVKPVVLTMRPLAPLPAGFYVRAAPQPRVKTDVGQRRRVDLDLEVHEHHCGPRSAHSRRR